MTPQEMDDMLQDECPEAVLIGDEKTRLNYYYAIVGIDANNGRVVYSRYKLVTAFMSEGMTEEEALEWISYNIDRSLPYQGEHAPIIMDEVLEVDAGDTDTGRGPDD